MPAVERGEDNRRNGEKEPDPRQTVALNEQARWIKGLPRSAAAGRLSIASKSRSWLIEGWCHSF